MSRMCGVRAAGRAHPECVYERGGVEPVHSHKRLDILAERALAAGRLPALKQADDGLMVAASIQVAQARHLGCTFEASRVRSAHYDTFGRRCTQRLNLWPRQAQEGGCTGSSSSRRLVGDNLQVLVINTLVMQISRALGTENRAHRRTRKFEQSRLLPVC